MHAGIVASAFEVSRFRRVGEGIGSPRANASTGSDDDARSITDDVLAQEGFEVAKKTVRAAGSSAGMTGGE